MKEDLYWIWISRMKNLYYEVFNFLISKYKTLENLWNLDNKELLKVDKINKNIIEDFCNIQYRENLEKYLDYMIKYNIKILNCYDENYPFKLKFIQNRPIVLYYKGDISSINNEFMAIVGSRNCSEYGRKCAKFFSYELAKRNVNIISGLATGIDSIAHTSAINAKGKTIAIIGNGLNTIYPKENLILADRILKNGGAIISEYVIGTKPDKSNFPRRNRIISGISNSVIVVEGSEKSGSLITANFAIDQGKEVWVIPGSIFCSTAKGSNKLLKDGANILTELSDIIRC